MVLTLWTIALRPHFNDYMQNQIHQFCSVNPGAKVDWVDVAYDALDRKLTAAAAAGCAPDVVNMADLNFARFASLGAFADLSAYTPADPRTEYIPGALGLCYVGDQLRALPWYVNPQTKILNLSLLKQGGYGVDSLPADWAGLVAGAKEFHAKTGKFLFSQPLGEESQLPVMLLAEGLAPFREVNGRVEADLNRPDIISYLGQWVDLYRTGALPREAATTGHAHLLELYQNAKLGVISTGPNFLTRVRDTAPVVYATTTVREGAFGALGRVHMPVMALAVTKQSRNAALATRLAWHLTSAQAQTEFCKQAPIMPSHRDSLSDPYFSLTRPKDNQDVTLLLGRRIAAATLPDAVAFTASLETWPNLRRIFEDEFKQVLLDDRPLASAVVTIQREWNKQLAESSAARISSVPTPAPIIPRIVSEHTL